MKWRKLLSFSKFQMIRTVITLSQITNFMTKIIYLLFFFCSFCKFICERLLLWHLILERCLTAPNYVVVIGFFVGVLSCFVLFTHSVRRLGRWPSYNLNYLIDLFDSLIEESRAVMDSDRKVRALCFFVSKAVLYMISKILHSPLRTTKVWVICQAIVALNKSLNIPSPTDHADKIGPVYAGMMH